MIDTAYFIVLAIMVGVPILIARGIAAILWGTTPTFTPSVGCETIRVKMGGGGGGGGTVTHRVGGTGCAGTAIGIMEVQEYYGTDIPERSIMEAAHQIASFALDQRDNVNMYSAIRERAVEVLTQFAKPQKES